MDLKKLTEQVALLSRDVAAFIRVESQRFTDDRVEI